MSTMYTCSADNKSVEYYQYTGSSSCDASSATVYKLNTFDESTNPGYSFECGGPPCPYYIVEDGVAHPTNTCPYDVGTGGVPGGNYATWHLKLVLEGCQTDETTNTSILLQCSSSTGVTQLNFDNPRCSFSNNGNTHNETLPGGELTCDSVGTGRTVFCSEEAVPSSEPTTNPSVQPVTAAPTEMPVTASPVTEPSSSPTPDPTTASPVAMPTVIPSVYNTIDPVQDPTTSPIALESPSSSPSSTTSPIASPTAEPSADDNPVTSPTTQPSINPSQPMAPTVTPTVDDADTTDPANHSRGSRLGSLWRMGAAAGFFVAIVSL